MGSGAAIATATSMTMEVKSLLQSRPTRWSFLFSVFRYIFFRASMSHSLSLSHPVNWRNFVQAGCPLLCFGKKGTSAFMVSGQKIPQVNVTLDGVRQKKKNRFIPAHFLWFPFNITRIQSGVRPLHFNRGCTPRDEKIYIYLSSY